MSHLFLILFTVCFFYTYVTYCDDRSVGTVLFSRQDLKKKCWSEESIALLNSRRIFQHVLPCRKVIGFKDDGCIDDLISYFQLILKKVKEKTVGSKKPYRHLMLRAMSDAIGGYMRVYVLPLARTAFYSGIIQFESVQKLDAILQEIKNFLRTNGLGWKPPSTEVECTNAQALPLEPPPPNTDPCEGLIHSKARIKGAGVCYQVPLPVFDSNVYPTAIGVPFRSYSMRNLESKGSAYILVKYYVAVVKCFTSKNTGAECILHFHNKFQKWMDSHVLPHLKDDRTYAAFGGVYRIIETIKSAENGVIEFNNITEVRFPGACSYIDEKTKKNNVILIALLVTIFVWFLIGSLFICYRIKAAKGGETFNVEIGTSSSGKSASTSFKKTFSTKSKSVMTPSEPNVPQKSSTSSVKATSASTSTRTVSKQSRSTSRDSSPCDATTSTTQSKQSAKNTRRDRHRTCKGYNQNVTVGYATGVGRLKETSRKIAEEEEQEEESDEEFPLEEEEDDISITERLDREYYDFPSTTTETSPRSVDVRCRGDRRRK